MTDDEIRERLYEGAAWPGSVLDEIVAAVRAVLPVVHSLMADELREIADDYRAAGVVPCDRLRAIANELEAR